MLCMPTPFPGMDPYLEQRGLWEQVHTRLIVAMADYLVPVVAPRFRVDIEQRVYLDLPYADPQPEDLVGKPDVMVLEGEPTGGRPALARTIAGVSPLVAELPLPDEVNERFLEVREVSSGAVITVIEVLSPSNKRPGTGRQEYQQKRLAVLGSRTHLVEVDLIRAGGPLPMRLQDGSPGDYRIVISRAYRRPRADVFAFSLRQPIPDFPVPLLRGETEPAVPLNQLLHDLYDRARYDLSIDYRRPAEPPLSSSDGEWVAAQLAAARQA